METISIRDIRGTTLRTSARRGKPLAITNHRVLIGVFISVAASWVEHLIECNWSQVLQSISEGERAMASGSPLIQPPATSELIEQLQAALSTPAATRQRRQGKPTTKTVRIGDLSAEVIESAGAAGQTVVITHQRELIGIVIPVTQDLVQFLIEQNLSRVLYNIKLGEDHLSTANSLTTLDQVTDREDNDQEDRQRNLS